MKQQKHIGDDLSKWYICKGYFGWLICPPVTPIHTNQPLPGFFTTGTEALVAFARGGRP